MLQRSGHWVKRRTGRAKVWRYRTLRMTLSLWKYCSRERDDRCARPGSWVLISLHVLSSRHVCRASEC